MPDDQRDDQFFAKLDTALRAQTDEIFRAVNNLFDAQTKALSRTLSQALGAQSDAVVAALNGYVVRIYTLEREVAALRQGQDAAENGYPQ